MNKYLYFELHSHTGKTTIDAVIKNANFLLNKPHTNSNGIWGFRNLTRSYKFNDESWLANDQYWVDLDKYAFGKPLMNKHTDLDKYIGIILENFKGEEIEPCIAHTPIECHCDVCIEKNGWDKRIKEN